MSMILKRIRASVDRISDPSARKRLAFWGRMFSFFIAVMVLGALTIDYGFVLDSFEELQIGQLYEAAWWYYLFTFTWGLVSGRFRVGREKIVLTVAMGLMLYLTLAVRLFPSEASGGWASAVWRVIADGHFRLAVLFLFAVADASRAFVSFISGNTNPALLLAATFAVFIFIGTILLMVPRSTLDGLRISVVDALFVSASAVCVTGLSPVDVSATFTLEGQAVLMLLIQVGGLGVMTITSFFAMFFMGSTGLGNQFALRDMVGSDTFSSLLSTLLYILGFTFVIELGGAALIWADIHGTLGMTLHQELFFAIFHSISAFCNAGFSTLGGNLGNARLMEGGHLPFYLVISTLVILGGIGYPILVNFKQILFYHIGSLLHRFRRNAAPHVRLNHIANLNSKIALTTTAFLLAGGTLSFALLEWNGSLAGMGAAGKVVHAFFNSAVTRTAGFNSVGLMHFSLLSLVVYTFLMWIGGASQSTAGGIKVNTFAVAVGSFISTLRGRSCVVMFNREISAESVRRTLATIVGSLLLIIAAFVLLTLMEPDLPPTGLLFEVVSAVSTVGASLGITPLLDSGGKVVVVALMFVGRVGLITVLAGLVRPAGARKYRYPKDNVIIN